MSTFRDQSPGQVQGVLLGTVGDESRRVSWLLVRVLCSVAVIFCGVTVSCKMEEAAGNDPLKQQTV